MGSEISSRIRSPENPDTDYPKGVPALTEHAVTGLPTDVIEWMEFCGARLPQTHGFASLNLLYKKHACAGLDQQPCELGARAVELLVAQLHRNECGVPEWATTTIVPARWVEGPTVRKAQNALVPDARGGAA